MSAILDDHEDVLAGLEKGERTVVVNPRELALQSIEDGRIREFETESGLKVPAQPSIDEDMDPDDVAAEQERARLEAVADAYVSIAHPSTLRNFKNDLEQERNAVFNPIDGSSVHAALRLDR